MLNMQTATVEPLIENGSLVRATVAQSTFDYAYRSLKTYNADAAWTLDGLATWVDVTTEMSNGVDSDLIIWGDDVAFGADNEWWVAVDNNNFNAIVVKYTVAADWTGDGIAVYESIDGVTLTPVSGLVDPTDGFREAGGIYTITWDNNASRTDIVPFFGETARRYIVFKPDNFSAAVAAPVLDDAWPVLADDVYQYEDITSMVNDAVTEGAFAEELDTFWAVENDAYIFGFTTKYFGIDFYMWRALSADVSGQWEYLSASGWTTFSVLGDLTTGFTTGPAVLDVTSEDYPMKFLPLADWTPQTLNGDVGFWVRFRITASVATDVVEVPLFRARGLLLSDVNSIYHPYATQYKSVSWFNTTPPVADDAVFAFVDTYSARGNSFTIAVAETANYEVYSSPIGVHRTGMLLVYQVSGSVVEGLSLDFAEA